MTATPTTPAAGAIEVCILDAQTHDDPTFTVHAVGCPCIAADADQDWVIKVPAGADVAAVTRAVEHDINHNFADENDYDTVEEYLLEGNGYTVEGGDVAIYPCTCGEECSRRLMLDGVQMVRLLSAFQALKFPSKFFHPTVTHKRAREVVEEMTGVKLIAGRVPEIPREPATPGGTHLQSYLDWASDNCHPEGA